MARRNDAGVELNLRGVNAVMKDPGVERELLRRAQKVATAAGPGVEAVSDNNHPWVARAYADIKTREAAAREARSNDLTRAIDAGRG